MCMTMTDLEKQQSIFKRLASSRQQFWENLEHQERVFNFWMAIIIGVFVLCMAWVIGLAIYQACNYNVWYEYIDLNGETGRADDCYTSKGNMVCKTGNTSKKVTEYTKFTEKK